MAQLPSKWRFEPTAKIYFRRPKDALGVFRLLFVNLYYTNEYGWREIGAEIEICNLRLVLALEWWKEDE